MKKKIQYGKYVIADPKICHGRLTFIGTRIFVEDVLDMVAQGLLWEYIMEQWHGNISKDAISEAVKLDKEFLMKSESIHAVKCL